MTTGVNAGPEPPFIPAMAWDTLRMLAGTVAILVAGGAVLGHAVRQPPAPSATATPVAVSTSPAAVPVDVDEDHPDILEAPLWEPRRQRDLSADTAIPGHDLVLRRMVRDAPDLLAGDRLLLADQPMGLCGTVVVLQRDPPVVTILAGDHDPTPTWSAAMDARTQAELAALAVDPAIADIAYESGRAGLDGSTFVADLRWGDRRVRLGHWTPDPAGEVGRLMALRQRLLAESRAERRALLRAALRARNQIPTRL